MEETQAFAEAGKDVENIEFVNAKSSRSEEAEDPKERAESPKSDKIPAKSEDGDQEKALEALKEKTVLLSQLKDELEEEKRNASLIKEEMKNEELEEERAAAELARK